MKCVVIGAGLAGLVASLELQRRGRQVILIEAGPFAGGRTSSWSTDSAIPSGTGLHVVANHYANLLDLLDSVGATKYLVPWRQHTFLQPDLPAMVWHYNSLPAPLHLLNAFRSMPVSHALRLRLLRACVDAARYSQSALDQLDDISYRDWHTAYGLGEGFVAELAELGADASTFLPLDRVSARAVLSWFKYMAGSHSSAEIKTWSVPLSKGLIDPLVCAFRNLGGQLQLNTAAVRINYDDDAVRAVAVRRSTDTRPSFHAEGQVSLVGGCEQIFCDAVILALPVQALSKLFDARLAARAGLTETLKLKTVPAISVTIAFDRKISRMPAGPNLVSGCAIRDFMDISNLSEEPARGSVLLFLVSHGHERMTKSDHEIVQVLVRDLRRILPAARNAVPIDATVEKIDAAMFAATTGSNRLRPVTDTLIKNLFMAGDFTRHDLNASMEGAVLSGRLAARAVLRCVGGNMPISKSRTPMIANIFQALGAPRARF